MNRLFSISVLFLIFWSNFGEAQILPFKPLSKFAQISIITTSPGEELYTVFGHAAIRVEDPSNQVDLVFGYGTFDFSTPNFYPEFVRGTLLYTLSAEPFNQFYAEFTEEPYQMKEQILNLDSVEKERLVDLLEINYRPENRFYRYDFFYDNCATRIRDILKKTMNEKTLFSPLVSPQAPTFRDLLKTYLIDLPWTRLGTDLILGIPADKKLSPEVQAFLPFYLSENLGRASILGGPGSGRPLVKSEKYLMRNYPPKRSASIFSPIGWFWLIFLFAIISINFPLVESILSALIFSLFSLLGFIILYLWLGTERTSFGLNFNVLWASPILWLIPFTKELMKKNLSIIALLLLVLFYVLMAFKIQVFNSATIPLSLTLLVFLLKNAGLWKVSSFLSEKPA